MSIYSTNVFNEYNGSAAGKCNTPLGITWKYWVRETHTAILFGLEYADIWQEIKSVTENSCKCFYNKNDSVAYYNITFSAICVLLKMLLVFLYSSQGFFFMSESRRVIQLDFDTISSVGWGYEQTLRCHIMGNWTAMWCLGCLTTPSQKACHLFLYVLI